ncbi:uncharacterized protein LOC120327209 [Styela clava]
MYNNARLFRRLTWGYYDLIKARLLTQSRCFSLCNFVRAESLKEHSQKPIVTPAEQHGKVADFERALFRRLEQAGFKRSRRFYWTVWTLTAAAVFGGGYLYFFPHKLRQQVVEEVSTVASQSLEDGKIVTKAGQLSKDVLSGILNDKETKVVASDFVKDVIVSDPIKEAAIGTILGLLNDPKVLHLLRIRLSEIILDILQSDTTKQIVISQVNSILQHESVRTSLQKLLQDLIDTKEVKLLMADFFKDVLASDTVKDQGKILGQQVTTDVITSKDIQEQAGIALWSAVKFSVIPNMFKSRSPNKTDDDIDKTETEDNDKKAKADETVDDKEGADSDHHTPQPDVQSSNNDDNVMLYYTKGKTYDGYSIDDVGDT